VAAGFLFAAGGVITPGHDEEAGEPKPPSEPSAVVERFDPVVCLPRVPVKF